MSFSGKIYKPVRSDNIDGLRMDPSTRELMASFERVAPTVCYTRLDEKCFQVDFEMDSRNIRHCFELGKEHEIETDDGCKLRITYLLEDEDVLQQIVKLPDGATIYFERQFSENECILTVMLEDQPHVATIYYQRVWDC